MSHNLWYNYRGQVKSFGRFALRPLGFNFFQQNSLIDCSRDERFDDLQDLEILLTVRFRQPTPNRYGRQLSPSRDQRQGDTRLKLACGSFFHLRFTRFPKDIIVLFWTRRIYNWPSARIFFRLHQNGFSFAAEFKRDCRPSAIMGHI